MVRLCQSMHTFTNTISIFVIPSSSSSSSISFSVSTRSHTYIFFNWRASLSIFLLLLFFSILFSIRQFNDVFSELEYCIHTVNEDVFNVRCLRTSFNHSVKILNFLLFFPPHCFSCNHNNIHTNINLQLFFFSLY